VVEPTGLTSEPDAGSTASPTTEDVAEAILYVLTRPPHVSIAEILIRPAGSLDHAQTMRGQGLARG